ncbi:LapA family protein [Nocardia inohanensis]|uniref:LapA family protein n=1 Tax=Nocardia inohanensis TaxID=209246 RepID=UPI00082A077A|nr:LapA family protein [Nocardia inohanensis]
MFIIIGLIALIGAVAVGVAGIQANTGDSHTLTNGFTVFDHTYTGSSGLLFAYGILIGAVGTCGLIMLLAGTWASSRRGMLARRELRQSKKEMAAARKELAKPLPETPASGQHAPKTPVPAQKPTWSFNKFMHRPGGSAAEAETVAK